MTTLYETLGIRPDASPADIKAAARKAQKQHHPDVGGTAEAFQKVQRAVAVLSDPDRRERYDSTGQEDLPKDPEAIERQQAMDVVAQCLSRATLGDARYTNLPDAVRTLISENIASLKTQLAQAERQAGEGMAKIDAYLKRLKKTKAGDDVLRAILESQRSALPRELAQRKAQIATGLRVCSKALEMVADYEYQIERPTMPTQAGTMQQFMRTF